MKRLLPYWLRVEARRAHRWLLTIPQRRSFARRKAEDPARYPIGWVGHSSKLIRQVAPEWMRLQENKVRNLEIACGHLDRLILRPGEVFSFCHLIGRTTRRKGYVDGLEMRGGLLVGAPGGGLCQLANLLFWMAVQLDLPILERHRHETDLFPDDERTVPFGMGATVFHNYRDLRFRNITGRSLMLRVSVEPPLLCGAILSDGAKPYDVRIIETHHRFVRRADGSVWRENRVAKRVTFADGRPPVDAEIGHHCGRVCYALREDMIEIEAPGAGDTGS